MLAYHRHYAHVLRTLAFIAAAVVAARILLSRTPGRLPLETGLRVGVVLLALAVGVLASPRRPRATLNVLALTLMVAGAAVNTVRLGFQSASPWEAGAVLIGVLLAAVFLLSWSWRWQLLLVVCTVGPTTALLWSGSAGSSETGNLLVTLVGVGAGSVVGVYLVQRFQDEVAASEARYRALFAGAHEAMLILSADGRVAECNPAFGQLVGYAAERAVGRPMRDFLSPLQPDGTSGADWLDRQLRAALAGERGTATGYLARADGRELEAELTCAGLRTPQGLVVQVMLRDLTERGALDRRQQRERRGQALARLAGGISHQFNNLLAGVLMDAVALRADAQREDQAQALDEIAEAARRGRTLARELVRFAQHEAVVLRRVAPAAIVERLTTLAQGTVVGGVQLAVDLPQGLPHVAADLDELVHAGLQLVVNAQDAMPEGGTITVSAFSVAVDGDDPSWPGAGVGNYVALAVRDNGKGMDAATRERAFEPFSGQRPLYEGPGLGLPAVYGIVRAHRGSVRIDSAPGHGTAVHLLIPAWKEEPAPAVSPPPAAAEGQRATVLVVDDEALVRHAINRALTRFGYRVLEAEDADTAVAQFTEAEPPVGLVLLDIVFPGGARKVFREIREQTHNVPVLLSSGFASHGDETIQALLRAGATGFLRKPYEVEELRHAVAHALGEADD